MRSRRIRSLLLHHQHIIFHIHRDSTAGEDFSGQQLLGEHGLHRMLHIAPQRPGAVLGIIGFLHDEGLGLVCQIAADLLLGQPGVELFDLQVYDLRDILLGQRLIENDLVQPV